MPQFSIRLEGDKRIRVGFNRFLTTAERVTKRSILAAMKRAMKRSVPYLGGNTYTVPVRGYKRTGNLGRSTRINNDGLTYTIVSDAYSTRGKPYSNYVIGDAQGDRQAKVHVGWWTKMRDSIDLEVDALLPEIDQQLQQGAEAAGL